MQKIFIQKVATTLKLYLKDSFKVYIENDTLFVDIVYNSKVTYKYANSNISKQIANGLYSQTVADIVARQYRKFLLSKHFTEKFCK